MNGFSLKAAGSQTILTWLLTGKFVGKKKRKNTFSKIRTSDSLNKQSLAFYQLKLFRNGISFKSNFAGKRNFRIAPTLLPIHFFFLFKTLAEWAPTAPPARPSGSTGI